MTLSFPLSISVSGESVSRVELKGELDVYTAPKLIAVLSDLLEQGCGRIVIDLSRLQFIDSVGLGTLIKYDREAAGTGGGLVLMDPSAQVRKVLRITALDQHLRIEFTGSVNRDRVCMMREAGYA